MQDVRAKFLHAHRADAVFVGTTRFFAVLVVTSLAAILVALLVGALPALRRFGAEFLWTTHWDPVQDQYGAAGAIFGTLVTSAIAMLIGVPVSFGIAVFVTELAPSWLKRPVGTAIELLAAIPSIIYGMWGLFVFAPVFAARVQPWMSEHIGRLPLVGPLFVGPPVGVGVFTAGIILAIMVIPFISSVTRDVFDTVPDELKESAHALGATTWEVVTRVVLPYTKAGVIGGTMLGLGRALGETMAVTFVIGNAHDINASLFMPGSTISSTLANEFTEAVGGLYTSSLIALGLILFCISVTVLALARLLLLRLKMREGKHT
jgi:phosphate transport system permease protein